MPVAETDSRRGASHRSALDCRSAPARLKASLASLGAVAALTRAVAVPVLQLPIDAFF
jgi:hypothetical protein